MSRPVHGAVLHVEGMDLSGKSTVTAYLGHAMGAPTRRNSLVEGNSIYLLADALRKIGISHPAELGQMYVEALDEDLRVLEPPTGALVQDSTILLRSLAFNQALGYNGIVADLLDMLPRHPRFGRSILLTASIDDRQRRLDERRATAADEVAPDDLLVESDPALFAQMDSLLIDYAVRHFDALVLDTSGLKKEETRAAVARLLA